MMVAKKGSISVPALRFSLKARSLSHQSRSLIQLRPHDHHEIQIETPLTARGTSLLADRAPAAAVGQATGIRKMGPGDQEDFCYGLLMSIPPGTLLTKITNLR